MSKWSKDALEEGVKAGMIEKETVTFEFYREKQRPHVLRKVCPLCGKVYDKFLIIAGPGYGCRDCYRKMLGRLGIRIAKQHIKEIESGMDKV